VGSDAHGDLVYGVPLGGSDEGWLLTGPKDKWGDVSLEPEHLPWLTPEQAEGWDHFSYSEVLELGLRHLDTVMFSLTDQPLSAGLEVHQHGYELRSFALALKKPQFGASWGDATDVDWLALSEVAGDARITVQFRRVLQELNLEPVNPQPRWFLTAHYF